MHPLVILIAIVYYVIVTYIIHTITGLGYGFSLMLTFIVNILVQMYVNKENY